MAEMKSRKPPAGKRETAKPEPAEVKARSKAASTKSSRGVETAPARPAAKPLPKTGAAPGDVTTPRKMAPARPLVPQPAAASVRRRGLPKPVVAGAAPAAASSRELGARPAATVADAGTEPLQRRSSRRRVRPAAAASPGVPVPGSGLESAAASLTEEERIESSKYDVRERPRRVFEEERFLFPETYEADRVRLLVKDPEWLFAHWDVSPGSLQRLRDDVGERAMALSRLTLKVEDPADSPLSVVLLPEGARSWYVRTHLAHRAYRAQLGLTMPSGEFRPLAMSNIVVAPRSGPSQERVRRRVAFSRAHAAQAAEELLAGGAPAPHAEGAQAAKGGVAAVEAVDYIDAADAGARPDASSRDQGGASGELGPGGASDTFRR